MSVQDGTRIVVLVACLVMTVGPWRIAQAQDDDIDLDALETLEEDAATLQAQAITAAVDERWDVARDKAQAALTLDTSVRTAQSRLVLARALEALGELDDALREVDTYLALPLLERDKARGADTRERIVARLRAKERQAADARNAARRRDARSTVPLAVRQRRAGAIGMLAGGAAPTIIGLWFVGTDLNYASRGIESGTWAPSAPRCSSPGSPSKLWAASSWPCRRPDQPARPARRSCRSVAGSPRIREAGSRPASGGGSDAPASVPAPARAPRRLASGLAGGGPATGHAG